MDLYNSEDSSRSGPVSDSSSASSIPTLPGEVIDPDINGRDVTYICPFYNETPGRLYVTNFRLFFQSLDKSLILQVPLGAISRIEKFGGAKTKGENSYGIHLTCKDIRSLKFALNPENHSRRDVFEKLKQYAFPLSHKGRLFCFDFSHQYPEDGWTIYNAVKEFERMGVPKDIWKRTNINEDYSVCDTYPAVWYVPQAASESLLRSVASFRSRGRIPILSWIHPETHASLTRCSQPLTGLSNNRSTDDEKYIAMIMEANAQSSKIYIMDARPKTNAHANRSRGGGFENDNHYDAEIQFLGIASIHVMRESLRKLTELCLGPCEDVKFFEELELSNWLQHIRQILSGAVRIVDKIEYQKASVVVHCSDGWDRTAQLTSLAMIMLDPYYRTLKGFEVLIEKEWLSFGHKFAQRVGHGEDKPNDDNRSPVFIQWLDCVWQLMQQFPSAFEFNEFLLIHIADHLYYCLFGTFLCNSEQQRKAEDIANRTVSLWSMINAHAAEFLNPYYVSAANRSAGSSVVASDPKDFVILPRCSAPFIQLWKNYFFRFNAKVSPRNFVDQIRSRNRELIDIREEMIKKVEELRLREEGAVKFPKRSLISGQGQAGVASGHAMAMLASHHSSSGGSAVSSGAMSPVSPPSGSPSSGNGGNGSGAGTGLGSSRMPVNV